MNLHRSFWLLFASGLLFMAMLLSPLLVGRLFGHTWGVLIGAVCLLAYGWSGRRWQLTPSTRLVWICGLCLILVLIWIEFKSAP